ncbi:MAG TPA: hypothetical protein VJB16_02260 [archaeon]|nr:hypothetical protein [archaeon]
METERTELAGETVVSKKKGFVLTALRPCVTKEGRILVELQLDRTLDPAELCDRIQAAYPDADVNPQLGVARIAVEDKAVLVFANGRIVVQRVVDAQDALRLLSDVGKALGIPIEA